MLFDLVIVPAIAITIFLLSIERPTRFFEEFNKFIDELFINWTKKGTTVSLYLKEFLLIIAFLLAFNLKLLLELLKPDTLLTSPTFPVFILQLAFLTLSCIIPAFGSYIGIVNEWNDWKSIFPIIAVYLSSIALVLSVPYSVPFLWFISGVTNLSSPEVINAGSIFFATIMVGHLIWSFFSVRVIDANRRNDIQTLDNNLFMYVTSIVLTLTIGSIPLMFWHFIYTKEPPFLFVFVIAFGYMAINQIVYAPYLEKIRNHELQQFGLNPDERIIYSDDDQPPYEVADTLYKAPTGLLDRKEFKVILTNQRLLHVGFKRNFITGDVKGFRTLKDIPLHDIKNVSIEGKIFQTLVISAILHNKTTIIRFYILVDTTKFRKELLKMLSQLY